MEMSEIYQYIQIVSSESMRNWSVGSRLSMDNRYNQAYPHRRIGEILQRDMTPITVQDDTMYKRITIHSAGGGVEIRDEKLGKDIRTRKQYVIKAGQFVVSKIDARNGAFGVVPKEADGAIITGNFWTFDVDYHQIVPEYLSLLTSTKEFMQFAESASNGTTNRHYLQESSFLEQEIPLPSVTEQRQIVDAYDAKINEAKGHDSQADELEAEMYRNVHQILGINSTNHPVSQKDNYSEYKHLIFVESKDIREWGYDSITGATNSFIESDIYPNRPLGEVVQINPRVDLTSLREDDEISFIPMECVSDAYGEWSDRRICLKSTSGGYTKFNDGDLIWAKITPCMQNGKSAVVTDMVNGVGCGSTEFYVLRRADNRIDIHYLHLILRLPIVLSNAQKAFTGSSGQQRVPKSYLEKLIIPIPPIDVQREVRRYVENVKSRQKSLRETAMMMRSKAKEEFKQIIFNN